MSRINTYTVYQLPFEDPRSRDLSFMNPLEIEAISDEYELVAQIDAHTLDEVFRIGNFVVDEDVTLRHVVADEGMRSISVGDIIHNLETDVTHVVDRIGFVKITMKEAA